MNKEELHLLVQNLSLDASLELNERMGLHTNYDQAKGNRCDFLTQYVMCGLRVHGFPVSRELHKDSIGNWHYLLAHRLPTTEPSDSDLISDLNPWQGNNLGVGILHAPRLEVIQKLQATGLSESFVALRGLSTLVISNHEKINPFSR